MFDLKATSDWNGVERVDRVLECKNATRVRVKEDGLQPVQMAKQIHPVTIDASKKKQDQAGTRWGFAGDACLFL